MTLSAHPIILIAVIRRQALIVCLLIFLLSPTSWFSFILFLVFMGGLIVLFIYISRLASNEKFNLNLWNNISNPLPVITIMMLLFLCLNSQPSVKVFMACPQKFIFKIYSPSIAPITSMTILYLLLALIIIVSITSLKEGALRQLK